MVICPYNHLQKVMSKRNPAPFEQQRVSVPIEEQEQKCLSVCAIRSREFLQLFAVKKLREKDYKINKQ